MSEKDMKYFQNKALDLLKRSERYFEFSPKGYGRNYYTFYSAIYRAQENKKVSIILTKNKNHFKNIILEFIKNYSEYRMEEYKKYYDIIKDDKLLVKITEELSEESK